MKVSLLAAILLVLCTQLLTANAGYAQKMEDKLITLELRNVSLRNALDRVESISGFRMAYLLEQVGRYRNISLPKDTRSVAGTLQLILSGTELDFKQNDNTILVFPKRKEVVRLNENDEPAAAPEMLVHGKVTDDAGKPLSGVSVYVKGNASLGTVTDDKGLYKLEVANYNITLVFSSVNTETKEVPVAGKNELNVVLAVKSEVQEEVVVVGYGTQKKKDVTGAISSVNSEHMNLGGTTANIAQAIQGRAAGVSVQQSDFSPGGSISVIIRGGNSINTTNEPLFVVDGFITDNGKYINPNDIENIEILKDASATAIYGARGGNGVVLITTKKGRPGKMQIEADVSNGYQYLTYKPSLVDGPQYAAVQNAIANEDGKPPVFPASFPVTNTNWWNLATQQASVLNRSVSLSGNDRNNKYYLSGNYMKQTGVLKSTDMERYSVRMGAEKKFSESVKVGSNFYGAATSSHLQRYVADITAPLFSVLTSPPSIPVYNANGSYYQYLGKDNALALLLEPTNVSQNKLINGNMFADYELIKGLTYHFSAGAEYSQTTAGQYTPRTLVNGQANNGVGAEQMNTALRWLVEQYLTYKYNRNAHAFTAMLGTSNQKDVFEGLGAGSRGFSTDLYLFYNLNAGSIPQVAGSNNTPGSSRSEAKLTSYFGRLNYAYNDQVLATFTLRRDGSSRFASNHKYGVFPSGALAWKMADLPFIADLNVFSNLKLRASYGITGNDRIGDYAYMSRFSNYGTSLDQSSNLSGGIEPVSLINSNLQWESNSQANVGIDMGFLAGRLNATIDLYRKKTSDLLLAVPIGQWWGFSTQILNAGSIENKGIELAINSENIKGKDFTWSTSFNIAYNRQKCLSLANNVKIISTNTANPSGVVSAREFTRLEPGKELGVIYGFQYLGVIKSGETYAPQPNSKPGDPKYADLDGDGKLTQDDRTYLGNTNPRLIAGLGNDFQYKNFNLNVFFQGAFGNHLYNMNRLVLESTTGTDVLSRWVSGKNENTDIPREGYFLSTYGSYVNSRFVENASYLRLKMVALSYSLPAKILNRTKIIDGLRIYASAQNLFTVTNYSGTDPEVNTHGGNLAGGIDFNAFPAFRTFVAGVKLTIH
ncbi:SusC/RagA family TonB-linked outer membrane protein [Niastella vici]|nr:TonB-dependent receptor [Niastella vici]